MKRQITLVIVLCSLFVVLLLGYLFVLRPLTRVEEVPEEAPETEAGEAVGTGNRFFLFGSLQRSDIAQIEVENEYGTFAFYQAEEGKFRIRGYDNIPYDEYKFATLVNVTAYTLSKIKVGTSLTDEKMEEYGLTTPGARWTVTANSGEKFTVLVGDRLLTGGGYYCMLEGRRSAYVLGTEVADTILCPIENYVTPVLVSGVTQNDYYMVDHFALYANGEQITGIRRKDRAEQTNPDALAEVMMEYPTAYYPDTNLYYGVIFSYLNFTADVCVKLGAGEADFAEVGLTEPAHRVAFTHLGTDYTLDFSERTEDGGYYVRSSLYPNVIGMVDGAALSYLETTLIDWIDPYVFQQYITNMETLTVQSEKVDAAFRLEHGVDAEGKALLAVTANGRGIPEEQIASFREFYKSLLGVVIQDYAADDEYCPLSEEELAALAADPAAAYLTFTATSLDREVMEYRFYEYSTRHSLVTVDGVGEFYVRTDHVKKIENDAARILAGEEVTAYEKD